MALDPTSSRLLTTSQVACWVQMIAGRAGFGPCSLMIGLGWSYFESVVLRTGKGGWAWNDGNAQGGGSHSAKAVRSRLVCGWCRPSVTAAVIAMWGVSSCLSVSVSMSLSVSLALYLSLSVCLSVCLCLSVCVCVCLSLSRSLCVCLSVSISLSLSLCLSVCL